ncbi:MAG: aminoacyl-tRNA hydrolase [Patescibacteria group bacterium]|nr:aminoacyl-tRNA hydrolase [Patescibacteria group bacterium]MCL5095715.1 aminoacyl-tRNA hydrolase [Patescibacteria group bacterium]
MKLIVGLGNPGSKYEKTRHNLGFRVVEALAKDKIKGEVKWEEAPKFSSLICRLTKDVILVKPQAFMNASGEAVAKIANFYKISASDIWVVHDDVDLPLGKIKIRIGGSAAGHHGVESLIVNLGTDRFLRIRLGIGRPSRGKDAQIEKYVLKTFELNETSEVKHLLKQAALALETCLQDGPEKTMNRFNC